MVSSSTSRLERTEVRRDDVSGIAPRSEAGAPDGTSASARWSGGPRRWNRLGLALALTQRIDGVVRVLDELTYFDEDTYYVHA